MRRYRTRGGSVKVNWILSRAAALRGRHAEENEALLHASLAICPSIDYLERAWQDATLGKPAEGPYIEVEVPTAIDPTLTDDGTTVMTMFTQYGPYAEAGWPEGAREAYAQRCLDLLAQYAPNVKDAVAALRGARAAGSRAHLRPRRRLDLPGRAGPRPDGVHAARRRCCRATRRRSTASTSAAPGTHPGGGVIAARATTRRSACCATAPRAAARARRHRSRPPAERPFRTSLPGCPLTPKRHRSKDRRTLNESSSSGLSRRSLLARAGGLALTAGAAAGLAGCENTTTPVRVAGAGGGGKGILGDPTAGGPVDASGIPLARRDYPVTLPRVGEPVKSSASSPRAAASCRSTTTPTTSTRRCSRRSASRRASSVRVTTFDTLDEAFTKLSTGRLKFDVIFTLARPALAARRPQADPAAELRAGPEPRSRTRGRSCTSPFYDVGPRYSIPYTVYTTGIGWRNDKRAASIRPSSRTRGTRSGRPSQYRGRVGILDDVARGARHGADAARRRPTSTPRSPSCSSRRPRTCRSSTSGCASRSRSPSTRRCPPGACGCTRRGRATCIGARHLLPAEGHAAERPLLLVPADGRADLQRLHLRRRPTPRSR